MAEHTPGPWRWNADFYDVRNSKDDCSIAVVLLPPYDDEAQANGRLIAWAPLLLKCIKVFLAPDDLTARDVGVWMEQARRVVAQLEGEQP